MNREIGIWHGRHLTHCKVLEETAKAFKLCTDDPFASAAAKRGAWIPKSVLVRKANFTDEVFTVKPWFLGKATRWQEVALGIAE